MAKKKRVSQPIPKERLHPPGGVNTEDAGGIFLEERVFHERRDGVASVKNSAKVARLADMGPMQL